MKRKYFIRGLGVGIILSALILCIFYRQSDSDISIVRQAKELGMDFVEHKNDKEIAEGITQGAVDIPQKSEPPAAASTTPEKEKQGKENKEMSSTKKAKTKKSVAKTAEITIERGDATIAVANRLERNGIIKSAEDFRDFMVQNGYTERINVGTFSIPIGADFSEIVKIIVS